MNIYARLSVIDELATCIKRAVRNAAKMPVINESNLIDTCEHVFNLADQLQAEVEKARVEGASR